MTEYMKNLIWMTLIVSVLMQMLPGDKYNKLFGMAAGWVILIVLLSPVLRWLGVDGIWQQAFAKALVNPPWQTSGNFDLDGRSQRDDVQLLQQLKENMLADQIALYVAQYLGLPQKEDVVVAIGICDSKVNQLQITIDCATKGAVTNEVKEELKNQLSDVFEIPLQKIKIRLEG